MSYQRIINPKQPITHAPCIHLRSKQMYVTGQVDYENIDESREHYCWCNLTQHVRGPDQQAVAREECGPGRDCYRETY